MHAIAYALARWIVPALVKKLDLAAIGNLQFEAPDLERFPALRLARSGCRRRQCVRPFLNAANEIAGAFPVLGGIAFTDIVKQLK